MPGLGGYVQARVCSPLWRRRAARRGAGLLVRVAGVDRSELIAGAGRNLPIGQTQVAAERFVAEDDVAALFGLELEPAPSQSGPKDPDTGVRSAIKRATTFNRSVAKGPISLSRWM